MKKGGRKGRERDESIVDFYSTRENYQDVIRLPARLEWWVEIFKLASANNTNPLMKCSIHFCYIDNWGI